jgi:hypothetical protein
VSTVGGIPLLAENILASLGNSPTVLPKLEGDGAGGRRIYFDTALDTNDIEGLAEALALKANVANPGFTGTADFAGCTTVTGLTRVDGTIKDAGIANALSYQLSFYAPRVSPTFSGVVTVNGSLAAGGLSVSGHSVPTANQLAAQFCVTGGGTVTWNGTALNWTGRVLVLPLNKAQLSIGGYQIIECPSSGTIPFYSRDDWTVVSTQQCTPAGIPMREYTALYYEIPNPPASEATDQTRLRLVEFQNTA